MNLKRSAAYVAISTISIGIVSYLIPFVGSRLLSADELAILLSIWAVLNTILLTLNSPLDLLLPKINSRKKESDTNTQKLIFAVIIFGLICGLISVVLLFLFIQLTNHGANVIFQNLILFTLLTALFNSMRSLFSASGKFKELMQLTLTYAAFGALGLTILLVIGLQSTNLMIVFLSIATCAALIFGLKKIGTYGFGEFLKSLNTIKSSIQISGVAQNFSVVLLMTMLTLIVNNGVVIGAQEIGIEASSIVVVVALSSFVRIPTLILNSASPPILNSATAFERENNFQALKSFYKKTLAFFCFSLLIIFFVIFLLSQSFIDFYLGNRYQLENSLAIQILLVECLMALIGLPRLFLVVLHKEKLNLGITFTGLIIFLFFATNDFFEGIKNLTFGVIISAFCSFLISHLVVKKKLKQLSRVLS